MAGNKTIDFFVCCCQTNNIREKTFGICDDVDESKKTPAYIDIINPKKWIAIVKNTTNQPINFTAIDNCVEILRDNGDMENRCDAMLTNEDNIIFIELKDQKDSWIDHAINDQLQTTINYFRANHDISKYRHKRAFACNKKHPRFKCSYKERMQLFYNKNHIRLNIQNEIIIK